MKNSSVKILFFISEDWFVCSHWLPLIEAATNEGLDVVVVTRTNKNSREIIAQNVNLIHLDLSRRGLNILNEIKTLFRLISIYRTEKPDIVQHIAMKPMLYGSLAAHITRAPRIVNWVAGLGWMFVSRNWRARFLKILAMKMLGILLRGTEIIVENRDDQNVIAGLGISSKQIQLVRGAGVNTNTFAPSPEPDGVPIVVLPARMLWDKGVREFVDAANEIRSNGIPARFVLVGDPDMENPASVPKRQLEEWNEQGVIEWWGKQEDMPRIIKQSHIVCLPSYREGLPKSLLEAASAGKPIVTTDVPGCREIVSDGENGILVEKENSTALASGIVRLLDDPVLRKKMGEIGRKRVIGEFSQEIIVAQVLGIYRGAVT